MHCLGACIDDCDEFKDMQFINQCDTFIDRLVTIMGIENIAISL